MTTDLLACIAGDPAKGERADLVVIVLGVTQGNEDADTVDVFCPERGEVIKGLGVYGSREDLEAAAAPSVGHVNKSEGTFNPRKGEDGRVRPAEFVDVLPWFNGVYPVPGDQVDVDQVDVVDDDRGDPLAGPVGRPPAKKTAAAAKK